MPARDIRVGYTARGFHRVEDAHRVREGVGHLEHRSGAGLLQVIRADVDRVPLGDLVQGPRDEVGRQADRRLGRKDVRPAREVLLQDVVLRRAGQRVTRCALLVGGRYVERQEPDGGRVDGHRRVHLPERDAVEDLLHVAEMADRDPYLADLALRHLVV
jgi:hypothetical protein